MLLLRPGTHPGLRGVIAAIVVLVTILMATAPASAKPFEPFEETFTNVPAPFFSDRCDLEVTFTEHVQGKTKIVDTQPFTELNVQKSTVVFTAEETDGRAVLLQRGVTRLRVTEVHGQPDDRGVVQATAVGRTVFQNRWTAKGATLLVETGLRTFTQRILIDLTEREIEGVPDDPMFEVLDLKGNLASDDERAAAVCPQLR